MTDFPAVVTSLPRRLRPLWSHHRARAQARVASASGARLVEPHERWLILARRLLPAVVALGLAEAFYLAGFFFDSWLTFPLLAVMAVALGAETTAGYRAQVAQRAEVEWLRRDRRDQERQAATRRQEAMDDLARLGAGAARLAAGPTLLSAQLSLLTPILTDLLATRSPNRRRLLLGQLELGAVEAARELMEADGAPGRALLYRRVGRRFEASWRRGDWHASPPAPVAGRTSVLAAELRTVLARTAPMTWTAPSSSGPRFGVRVPLHAGRRHFGVLWAERSGERPAPEVVEAIAIVAGVLMAGAIASRAGRPAAAGFPPSMPEEALAADDRVVRLAGGARRVRAAVSARLAPYLRER